MKKICNGIILIFFCLYTSISLAQVPDLILTHGKIFTSDTTNLFVEAIALKGERIMAVK